MQRMAAAREGAWRVGAACSGGMRRLRAVRVCEACTVKGGIEADLASSLTLRVSDL
jgi:hypothetical protein